MDVAGDLGGSRDRMKAPYLVGVVVRVANHSVHPVWFRRAKGTNGCRRLGVFTSAMTNKQKSLLTSTLSPVWRQKQEKRNCRLIDMTNRCFMDLLASV